MTLHTHARCNASRSGFALLVFAVAVIVSIAGCSPPIQVRRADPDSVHRMLTGNVLTTGDPSVATVNTLYVRQLTAMYDDDPAAALARLHEVAVSDDGTSADLMALAELSFRYAGHGGGKPHYLAAAVYAYTVLFAGDDRDEPNRFTPEARVAADIYNRGLTEAFETESGDRLELAGGSYDLPFGLLDLDVDSSGFRWGHRELVEFTPVADLTVKGLQTRRRQPGIGAPLAAKTRRIEGEAGFDILAKHARLPVTALMTLDNPLHQLGESELHATLEIVPAFRADTVAIDGEAVPLEVERTATLAYVLADSPVWKREMRGFLGQVSSDIELPQLVATEPHRPGLIPVAFVHGTASSPGRWAQMVNELMADPRIRDRFFFMFFFYDTGNPIAYSSMLLRDYLIEAVTGMDPTGSDPCAHEMVVIGHSQGGLLTKMTAVHTGDRLWHNISNEPIEETKLKPETREILQRALFVDPLPFVRKVVFVCTPHRGSFLARRRINDLISRLVHLPGTLLGVASDLMVTTAEETAFGKLERIPTSVDNMTPGSPFVQALSIIPTAPGVAAHSIIAVEGDGPIETGNDGVVAYESAHIDGVDSEVVVRSSHSVQANPEAIAEVKRILLEHAGRSACPH